MFSKHWLQHYFVVIAILIIIVIIMSIMLFVAMTMMIMIIVNNSSYFKFFGYTHFLLLWGKLYVLLSWRWVANGGGMQRFSILPYDFVWLSLYFNYVKALNLKYLWWLEVSKYDMMLFFQKMENLCSFLYLLLKVILNYILVKCFRFFHILEFLSFIIDSFRAYLIVSCFISFDKWYVIYVLVLFAMIYYFLFFVLFNFMIICLR